MYCLSSNIVFKALVERKRAKKNKSREQVTYMFYKWGSGCPWYNTVAPYVVFGPFTSQVFCKLINCSWKFSGQKVKIILVCDKSWLITCIRRKDLMSIALTFTCCINSSSTQAHHTSNRWNKHNASIFRCFQKRICKLAQMEWGV